MADPKGTMHPEMERETFTTAGLYRDMFTGALAGQAAGLVMAVAMMAVFTIFLGKTPLFPVQVIGSIIYGDIATQGFHFPSLIAGLLLHQLGPSLVWGMICGGILNLIEIREGAGLIAVALVVGMLSQIIDVNLILPVAFNAMHGHNIWAEQVPAVWSWTAHLVYGLGLMLYPWLYERLGTFSK
jgi:hypothetical protein